MMGKKLDLACNLPSHMRVNTHERGDRQMTSPSLLPRGGGVGEGKHGHKKSGSGSVVQLLGTKARVSERLRPGGDLPSIGIKKMALPGYYIILPPGGFRNWLEPGLIVFSRVPPSRPPPSPSPYAGGPHTQAGSGSEMSSTCPTDTRKRGSHKGTLVGLGRRKGVGYGKKKKHLDWSATPNT
ncbi:hypothetical protein LY78DRAFT_227388 [Colletotrichum sublineola]|nr:hypothetical protein LY78DRAFT_227388 [Colletotrichum sublineola]